MQSDSAYHHQLCEFDPVQARCTRYNIMFVSDLRQASGLLWFPPPIKLTSTIYWNIVERGIKHHNP